MKIFILIPTALIVLLSTATKVVGVNSSRSFEWPERKSVDTVFTVNSELWTLQLSYFAAVGDSADMELILFAKTTQTEGWYVPTFIGTVGNSFKPNIQQMLTYVEPSRTWEIRMLNDGKCFIELKQGELPAGNPQVVVVKTKYKLN